MTANLASDNGGVSVSAERAADQLCRVLSALPIEIADDGRCGAHRW